MPQLHAPTRTGPVATHVDGTTDRAEDHGGWHIGARDAAGAALIAAVMAGLFWWLSPGWALRATFLPGVAVTLATVLLLARRRVALPSRDQFLPVYVLAFVVQLVHFAEEYGTGFLDRFARRYGEPVPPGPTYFVTFNMTAYAVFLVATVVAFSYARGALLLPSLFFVIYGCVGNPIAHTFWTANSGAYFPGFFTAQAQWPAGAVVLRTLLGPGRWRHIGAIYLLLAILILPLLWWLQV